MGQKVNPTSLRLHAENKHFDSCWFSEKQYAYSIHKDLNVETYYNAVLKQIEYPSASFFLEAAPRKCQVSILFLNPTHLREQVFRQFDSATSRSRKTGERALFSRKKGGTPFHGLSKERGGVTEPLPLSLFAPSFLQNLKNKDVLLQTLKNGKKSEEGGQKKEDRALPLFDKIGNQSSTSLGRRPLQEGDPALKKQGMVDCSRSELVCKPTVCMVDRQTDLHSKPPARRGTHHFGKEARRGAWSSLLGLAISRYFVERRGSEDLLSATSRFLLLQAFFSSLNPQERGSPSDVLGGVLSSKGKDALLAKRGVELQEDQKDAHPSSYRSEVHDLRGGFAKGVGRQEDESFSSLQKSSIYAYHTESIISNRLKSNCKISFFRAQNVAQNALFVAEEIVYQLERRSSFRQIKSKFLQELGDRPAIKGVRVTCVGRIGGRAKKAQRARGESFKMGQTSLHLFNSKVSFASKTALTPFGAAGVKVWICWK